jgi:hypothetical protein
LCHGAKDILEPVAVVRCGGRHGEQIRGEKVVLVYIREIIRIENVGRGWKRLQVKL